MPSARCRWCERVDGPRRSSGSWVDAFGEVVSQNGRIRIQANWARSATVSGLVFGDRRMHDLLELSQQDFLALFEAAGKYIAQAVRKCNPSPTYFIAFINGGARSGATVQHAHLQVVGRHDRPFSYQDRVVTHCPADYWARVQTVHDDLGLSVRDGRTVGWASLVPTKERDVSVVSHTLGEGAALVFNALQALYRRGTNTFSLAAILSPSYVRGRGHDQRFWAWPNVLWRLVDRGDTKAAHADIGSMELFGSSVIATDPFLVADWLKEGVR